MGTRKKRHNTPAIGEEGADSGRRDPVIAADRVCFRYGRGQLVLQELSFCAHGQVIGILGPNGAGKSTLLSLATGAQRLGSGNLSIVGENIRLRRERQALQRRLGFVPQAMSIFSGYTVEQFALRVLATAGSIGQASDRHSAQY